MIPSPCSIFFWYAISLISCLFLNDSVCEPSMFVLVLFNVSTSSWCVFSAVISVTLSIFRYFFTNIYLVLYWTNGECSLIRLFFPFFRSFWPLLLLIFSPFLFLINRKLKAFPWKMYEKSTFLLRDPQTECNMWIFCHFSLSMSIFFDFPHLHSQNMQTIHVMHTQKIQYSKCDTLAFHCNI